MAQVCTSLPKKTNSKKAWSKRLIICFIGLLCTFLSIAAIPTRIRCSLGSSEAEADRGRWYDPRLPDTALMEAFVNVPLDGDFFLLFFIFSFVASDMIECAPHWLSASVLCTLLDGRMSSGEIMNLPQDERSKEVSTTSCAVISSVSRQSSAVNHQHANFNSAVLLFPGLLYRYVHDT